MECCQPREITEIKACNRQPTAEVFAKKFSIIG